MPKLLATLILLLSLASIPAHAQRVSQLPGMSSSAAHAADRIAAIVNDNVITTTDLEARMKLAFLSSGLPDTPEVRGHILPQVLRGLIDEQLQLQEAKRLDITVSKEDIEKAMESIAHDNHIPGNMHDFLKQKGASPEALEQQIRAGLSWSKVVQRELRSRVEVGDEEVDSAIARIRTNAGKQEYLVSEIFLSVDNAKDEDQVKQVAERLVQQIKSGANFAAVARQFSQSTGAASGGDIGWIQQGQLPAELNHALETMQTEQVTAPIRSTDGFHILALREKRTISLDGKGGEVTLDLQQAFRAVPHGSDRDAAVNEAHSMRSAIVGCDNIASRMTKSFPNWHLQATAGMKLTQAPAWLADKVRDLPVGKASDALSTDKGLLVVYICSRHMPEGNIDREAIVSSIGTEKLELQARRLQRDLRRTAYLDIRLGNNSKSTD